MYDLRGTLQSAAQKLSLATAAETRFLHDLFGRKGPHSSTGKLAGQNIVIVGGELFNKGAQAMTFTVVDNLRRRYPNRELYLLSYADYERPDAEKEQYRFEILPWGTEARLGALTKRADFLNDDENATATIREVMNDCACVVDISGYALSSQWGFNVSFMYLVNLAMASSYSVPVYVLPQSIGPFEYPPLEAGVLNPLMNLYLSYPEIIYSRERRGVDALSSYTTHNVEHELDIVLQSEGYHLENVFTDVPEFETVAVENDAMGVVPNSRVMERVDHDRFYTHYDAAIEAALRDGYTVYILRHSTEDRHICERISARFADEPQVRLLKQDLNAIELERVIEQFDFMIGSRYHSIVHAYKNGVPAIAIGWADKYGDLLEEFDQSEFFFDAREPIQRERLVRAVSTLAADNAEEGEQIDRQRSNIIEGDVFRRTFPPA